MNAPRLTVSELTRALQDLMADAFPWLSVVGVASKEKFHSSGHWYLTLTDGQAILNAAFFRLDNQKMRWRPKPGDRVIATGRLDIYPPSGRYNLVIRELEQAGAGDLAARLEALKKRLAAEGLFDPSRKRPLPAFPRRVGIVTSATGAALQDVLKVVDARFPGFPLVLSACRVQGAGAAREVAVAIERLDRHGRVDVIIVARGGGSAEDLWTFNEETVVRAIAASGTPVVSGVGHEVDVTLVDLAADVRAATPSHAAEIVIPDRAVLADRVAAARNDLVRAIRRNVDQRRRRVDSLKLQDPRRKVAEARIRCDDLESRLKGAVRRRMERHRSRMEHAAGRLDAVSPLAVLGRGYAIALRDGHAVRDADEVSPGDGLDLLFARGRVRARVEG